MLFFLYLSIILTIHFRFSNFSSIINLSKQLCRHIIFFHKNAIILFESTIFKNFVFIYLNKFFWIIIKNFLSQFIDICITFITIFYHKKYSNKMQNFFFAMKISKLTFFADFNISLNVFILIFSIISIENFLKNIFFIFMVDFIVQFFHNDKLISEIIYYF